MIKREKVIKTLEACGSDICDNCPYYGKDGWCEHDGGMLEGGNGFVEVPRDMLADALALLKVQEPRVLTLDEVRDSLKQPVWKDTKSSNAHLYTGWVLAYDIQKGQGITGERLGMAEPSGRVAWYRLEDYGRTWRCWDKEPTDEQRKAVKWE